MKNLFSLCVGLLAFGYAVGQSTYPCVLKSQENWYLSGYSSASGDFDSPTLDLGSQYTKNTFLKLSDQDQYVYSSYDGTSSTIHIFNEEGGHYTNLRRYENVLSLNYFEKQDKLVYLSTRYVPNYYDFLSEDISITILDFDNNTARNVKIPTFSIYVPSLPYIGERKRTDNRGVEQKLNYAISLPTIDMHKNEFMFVAKDIPGMNRLIRMNLETYEVTTTAVGHNVLSLVYCSKTKETKALIFEPKVLGDGYDYYIANLNTVNGLISNKVFVSSYAKAQSAETSGSLAYDYDRNVVLVSKQIGSSHMVFEVDENNQVTSTQQLFDEADIAIPLPYEANKVYGLGHYVKMYPNPTNSVLTIESTQGQEVEQITVMDATGKVVKNVAVQSGLVANDIDVAAFVQGVYYVRIEARGQSYVEKVVKY